MRGVFRTTYAVGFDLDGTLYPPSTEIDNRIRNRISERILERKPDLGNIETARSFFEENYTDLGRGSEVLRLAGYENAREVMDECCASADVLDLIERNDNLIGILEGLYQKYFTYLLTSSPEQLSLQKLQRIGIDPRLFSLRVYGDIGSLDKMDGTAFDYAIISSSLPADEHVYIGDRRQSDILPAKKKGMKAIAVHSEISEADLSLKSINDIRGVLL